MLFSYVKLRKKSPFSVYMIMIMMIIIIIVIMMMMMFVMMVMVNLGFPLLHPFSWLDDRDKDISDDNGNFG